MNKRHSAWQKVLCIVNKAQRNHKREINNIAIEEGPIVTFEQYWAILIKQWKLIVICFVFVGLGAFLGSRLISPTYQSTALVQVAIRSTNSQSDYNSLLASDQLVQTEAQLAVSDPVL